MSGGVCFAPIALRHSTAFWSAQEGVPSPSTWHVKPFEPVCRTLGGPLPCAMMIVALFTIDGGAAVLALAMYSGSVLGTSSVGNSARAAPERFESERVFGPAWI